MSFLLRLYPRAWRERYGDELAALLADRPATMLDRMDLVRGALDARLHPQLPGSSVSPAPEIPLFQRQLGFAAALGGMFWILGVASLLVLPRDVYGDLDASLAAIALAIASVLIGISLAELGNRAGSASSARTGHAVAYVSFFVGATLALGWPLFIFGFYLFPFMAWLSAVRAVRNSAFPRWFAAVFTVGPLAMIVGGLSGVATEFGPLLIGAIGPVALILAALAFRTRPAASTVGAA